MKMLYRESVLLISLYSIIFVISVVGNALVIATLLKNRRIRTITNIYLVNLAVSDLILAIMCIPFTLTGQLLQNFIFGQAMCRLIAYMQAVSVSASVWTLVTISLERYFAICRPLSSRRWQTMRHSLRFLSAIWLWSTIVALPILIYSQLKPVPISSTSNVLTQSGNVSQMFTNKIRMMGLNGTATALSSPELSNKNIDIAGHVDNMTTTYPIISSAAKPRYACREIWGNPKTEMAYNWFLNVTFFVIPLGLMIYTYSSIVLVLWETVSYEKQFHKHSALYRRVKSDQLPNSNSNVANTSSRKKFSLFQSNLETNFLASFKRRTSPSSKKLSPLVFSRQTGEFSIHKATHNVSKNSFVNDNHKIIRRSSSYPKPSLEYPQRKFAKVDMQRRSLQHANPAVHCFATRNLNELRWHINFGPKKLRFTHIPKIFKFNHANYPKNDQTLKKIIINDDSSLKPFPGPIRKEAKLNTHKKLFCKDFGHRKELKNSPRSSSTREYLYMKTLEGSLKKANLATCGNRAYKKMSLKANDITFRNTNKSSTTTTTTSKTSLHHSNTIGKYFKTQESAARSLENKMKIIRMLCVIVIEFFLCWTPIYVINTWHMHKPESLYSHLKPSHISIVHFLSYVSACCNPVTYCFLNAKFRQSLCQLLQTCFCTCVGRRSAVSSSPTRFLNNNNNFSQSTRINNNNFSQSTRIVRMVIQNSRATATKFPQKAAILACSPTRDSSLVIGNNNDNHQTSRRRKFSDLELKNSPNLLRFVFAHAKNGPSLHRTSSRSERYLLPNAKRSTYNMGDESSSKLSKTPRSPYGRCCSGELRAEKSNSFVWKEKGLLEKFRNKLLHQRDPADSAPICLAMNPYRQDGRTLNNIATVQSSSPNHPTTSSPQI